MPAFIDIILMVLVCVLGKMHHVGHGFGHVPPNSCVFADPIMFLRKASIITTTVLISLVCCLRMKLADAEGEKVWKDHAITLASIRSHGGKIHFMMEGMANSADSWQAT